MKNKIASGLFYLMISMVVALSAMAQSGNSDEGELDLDAMQLSEDGDPGDEVDTLVLEDDPASDVDELSLDDLGGDVEAEDADDIMVLDDGGETMDPGDGLAEQDEMLPEDDTLVLEQEDESDAVVVEQQDEMQLEDDSLVRKQAQESGDVMLEDSDVMVLDDSGDMLQEEDTLILDDGEPVADEGDAMVLDDGEPVADESDTMVLDDGEPVVDEGDTMVLDDGDMEGVEDDLADIMDLPEGVGAADSEEVMVLEDTGPEMSSEDADMLEGLDAEMLGMEDAPTEAAMAAESGTIVMDDAELSSGAADEMSGLDAEMADMGMMGEPEGGAETAEAGTLNMDGTEEVMDATAISGDVLVMDDADDQEQEDEQTSALSVYAVLKNETAVFTRSGTVIGNEKSTRGGGSHNAGKLFKSEFSLNVFANAQITPNALVHTQLNLSYDPKAEPDWYRGPQWYTQYDPIRELYLDTTLPLFDDEGVLMRLGKQQVVWGTADGIKLLDIINPTDYRELVQNTFEDSRIPVWMLNLERNIGDSSNFQFIVAQNRRNRIPGLDEDGDSGQPFIAQGVDSITGRVNGFLNIAPAMGKVADAFNRFAASSGSPVGLTPLSFVTVNDFATNSPVAQSIFGSACSATFDPSTPTSAACLKDITERPDKTLAPGVVVPGGDNQFVTNLIDAETQSQWDTGDPNSAFEYMGNATFATFNTFVSAKSAYRRDNPDGLAPNIGGRWKSSFGSNFNYSLNYFYSYDANPSVAMHWENDAGEKLQVKKVSAQQYVNAGILKGIPAGSADLQTVILKDDAGGSYGPFDGDPTSAGFGGPGAGSPTLVFTEKQHRIHNLGASFDYAMDTAKMGSFILRGEFLYQRNVRTPLINRTELSIGNLTEGLLPDEVDFFKYVLGAETILFTNLTVSAQFIQFVNLNFKGSDDVYHGSQAALSLTNDLKKGYKYNNFGSLFLSKPFGTQQDGRVNNIIIAERGGGYWNRLDLEYRFTDSLIGSAEWNSYFGNRDTQFGQFKDSSNFQLGIKYIFE